MGNGSSPSIPTDFCFTLTSRLENPSVREFLREISFRASSLDPFRNEKVPRGSHVGTLPMRVSGSFVCVPRRHGFSHSIFLKDITISDIIESRRGIFVYRNVYSKNGVAGRKCAPGNRASHSLSRAEAGAFRSLLGVSHTHHSFSVQSSFRPLSPALCSAHCCRRHAACRASRAGRHPTLERISRTRKFPARSAAISSIAPAAPHHVHVLCLRVVLIPTPSPPCWGAGACAT